MLYLLPVDLLKNVVIELFFGRIWDEQHGLVLVVLDGNQHQGTAIVSSSVLTALLSLVGDFFVKEVDVVLEE